MAERPNPFHKILIPLDFSASSMEAFERGMELAETCGAEVVLASVVDTSFPYPDLFSFEDPNSDYFKVMRERALARMEEAVAEHRAARPGAAAVVVDRFVGRGRPKVEIPAIAREVGADLVVIARHGVSASRHALGGTTEAVLRTLSLPVLVVGSTGEED